MINAGERANVGIDQPGVLANNGRTAHHAVDDFGPFFDGDAAVYFAVAVHVALNFGREFFQHQAVGLEHFAGATGVNPPAAVNVREDVVLVVDQPLNGVGNFQLAAPTGVDGVDRLKNVGIKHVNAHQRQIAGRLFGFFNQADNAVIFAQFGHAVLLRLVNPGEHNLRVVLAAGKLGNQRADAALNHVIAQKHHKAIIAQKIVRNFNRVGQPQRRILRDVGDFHAPLPAAPHGAFDLFGGVTNHNANFGDAGIADGLDNAEQDGFVGYGN